MARGAANLSSIEVVRLLKPALLQFADDVQNALVLLELEARRPVEWMEHDRARYWPREVQKASDAVSEARVALERCKMALREEDRRYCYDERKALEKAKNRLQLCEAKVQAVRRWRPKIRKEVEEFQVEVAKLKQYLDQDFLRAVAVLARMVEALDRYVETTTPGAAPSTPGSAENAAEPLHQPPAAGPSELAP